MSALRCFARNTAGRDVAVGDIHGCIDAMLMQLECAGFDRACDRLFATGDLVDRGPDSHRVDELLAQPWFFSVQGNHDDMAIRFPKGNMDTLNYASHGGAWNIGNVPAEQQRYADLLATMPHAIEVETEFGPVGIVHANVRGADWPDFLAQLDAPRGIGRLAKEIALWDRSRVTQHRCEPVGGVRAIVVGHSPAKHRRVFGNVHHIDTGGWAEWGAFTFLDLATLSELSPAAAVVDWTGA